MHHRRRNRNSVVPVWTIPEGKSHILPTREAVAAMPASRFVHQYTPAAELISFLEKCRSQRASFMRTHCLSIQNNGRGRLGLNASR
ncbi:hypothetical protein BXY66_0196 [Shimia isoporae]|uniref:Uncharacterized protein n=1 Tax=Shimia isoporae TaxID=647720 RepID=A0A4R1NNM6_9RHOB|nr:hypothetical protein BXY66_0196 [Shimia isoporae]